MSDRWTREHESAMEARALMQAVEHFYCASHKEINANLSDLKSAYDALHTLLVRHAIASSP